MKIFSVISSSIFFKVSTLRMYQLRPAVKKSVSVEFRILHSLREEHRLRVLRGIFGAKRDEDTGQWRKLHNDELNYLYPHPILCG
jgi:hypothetical protein